MSTMKPTIPKLDSVDSIYHYLREEVPTEVVVSSTTPSTIIDPTRISSPPNRNKRQKKEKAARQPNHSVETISTNSIQVLPTGRVRYGPITVNPRKHASKTLSTGRRSKNEVLSGEEEEKRRLRRERNRVAALKCRVKRDDILNDLEQTCDQEMNRHSQLVGQIRYLGEQKRRLQAALSNLQPPPPSIMVFGNANFLSSIVDTPAPPLPSHQLQLVANNEQEFTHLLHSTPLLTNSAYTTDQPNYLFNSQIDPIPMNTNSFEQMLTNLSSANHVDDNNNNSTLAPVAGSTTYLELCNSAYGTSTCAQQHSSSSEDDSMPSTHRNPFVY